MSANGHRIKQRYSRQVLFAPIGETGQKRIMQARAALIGCGGLGSVAADILVRAGIGFLRIVDRDFVEESNLQRQVLFDTRDVRDNLPKAEAARRKLAEINPDTEVAAVVRDVNSTTIMAAVKDVDLIVDGTDNFETRYLINDAAVSLETPWIYGSAVGSFGMAAGIVPQRGPCLCCLFEDAPPPGAAPTCDNAGVLASIIHIVASIQATEALKLLCRGDDGPGGTMHYVDVWKGEYRTVRIANARNPDCETCGRRTFRYLNAERGSFTTSMCGRDAVQISWKEKHVVDFPGLAETLRPSGEVSYNRFMLKFDNGETRITLFPDGRAIVEGTTDPDRARELYAKFIG